MKAAFAYWGNYIAPVFDTARQIRVVEVECGVIVDETEVTLAEDLPAQRTLRLVELGIHTLVCGAISKPMYGLLAAYGIRVIPFLAGDLREIIQAWRSGNLHRSMFAMPGCTGRGARGCRGMVEGSQEEHTLNQPGRERGTGAGQGRSGGGTRGERRRGSVASGPAGYCVCPQCGERVVHERGVPCAERTCPKCGAFMTGQQHNLPEGRK